MKKFITLKHWQLVALIFLPSVWNFDAPWSYIAYATSGIVFLTWLYSIGKFGQPTINSLGLRPMNLKLFRLNIILLPVLFIAGKIAKPAQAGEFSFADFATAIIGIYSGFATFQVLLFAAKTIAKIEYNREVSFGDYLRNFIQIACFIIGIWELQPRINRLLTKKQANG